ncbi:hypothetical protein Patl1_03828 [Pistacia atlantica]|uniref:Uncharacterized protein n=1 Tax=Pistacia atlantica TaxID=434234 RepID=A0ACC1BNK9_9ROSI|nr:hypothetical protein Patl1_03828 [Pistacia atlantica]
MSQRFLHLGSMNKLRQGRMRNAQPSEKMKDAYAKDQKIMMYATSPLSSYIDLHICLLFSKFQVLMTSLGAGS